MSKRLQNILGISFFLLIIIVVVWFSFRMKEQNKLIDDYGAEAIATIKSNKKPVKSRAWNYTFMVNNKIYKGTTSNSKNGPYYEINTGYEFIVEYYVKNPEIHRLMLNRPYIEKGKEDPFMLDSLFKEIDRNIGID